MIHVFVYKKKSKRNYKNLNQQIIVKFLMINWHCSYRIIWKYERPYFFINYKIINILLNSIHM
jgi:hypothetical protein